MAETRPARLVSIRVEPEARRLSGAGASQQLLVIGTYSDGGERDLTDEAQWRLSNNSLARIDNGTRLVGLADGNLALTATVQGHSARTSFRFHESSGLSVSPETSQAS